MSRSMNQINIYMKILHNVKVNDSNQYLYENPTQCQGQWLKSIFIWKSCTMSRSMTQINMYMKIMHNVKVNDSNQYLYENPAQCQLCGFFIYILIWVIDLDIVQDFHIHIDLSHWPWHCVGFSYKYWFESLTLTLYGIFHINIDLSDWPDSNQYVYENHAQCQGQWLKSIFIWKSCTMSRSMPYQYLCACYILCLCVYCNSIFKYMKQQVSSCMPLKSVLYE
jgi:hypothetical protein